MTYSCVRLTKPKRFPNLSVIKSLFQEVKYYIHWLVYFIHIFYDQLKHSIVSLVPCFSSNQIDLLPDWHMLLLLLFCELSLLMYFMHVLLD